MATETTTDTTDTTEAAPQVVPVFVNTEGAYRRHQEQQYFAAVAEAKTLQMDEAPVGGRYTVHGLVVDANGNPIND